jgi:aminoglycoside phosphotransferase (APT) family kinase protein
VKLGSGGSAEVFAWGDDGRRVLKLFHPQYAFAVDREAECTRAVHDAGVASPAVYEVVDVNGTRGIVLERVDGPTLLEQLLRGDRRAFEVGAVLAEVHLAMHETQVPELPDLAAMVKEQGLEFPAGSIVFHGDFHPGNVIAGAGGPCTIDWVNAHLAPRAADVARTVMAVRYQALAAEQPAVALDRERAARARTLDAYLSKYFAAQPSAVPEMRSWLQRAAGALLRTEASSADVADVRAFATGRFADVREPVLKSLMS